jgi:ATP-binding cassette subfamily F protein uup
VFLVSHDRRFLDNVVTSTLVAEGNGAWREYEGDVQDWLTQSTRAQSLAAAQASPRETPAAPTAAHEAAAPRSTPSPKRKLSYKEQRELDALPAQIEALENEQTTLEKALADGQLYANDPPRAAQMAARLMEVEEQWLAAMERLETLQTL